MKRAWLVFPVAAAAALYAGVALAQSESGTDTDVIWSADHETGDLSQWTADDHGGPFNTGTGTESASTDVAHTGRYSAVLTIRGAHGAAQAARIFRWDTEDEWGTDAYYSAWFYFPQRYRPAVWWNIFQFKSEPDGASQSEPAWSINVGNRGSGQMYLYLWDAITEHSFGQTMADLPEKKWVHLEAYYVRAVDSEGRITVWQDGRQLWDVQNVQTTFADNLFWSVNSYTDDITPSTVTIYVDDAAITHTRQSP
ncbi:MAG: heparin lyase I family protein [Chloroflexi bacterium]|nr:heparin lyase I family protein [Chloroflexota bacterium]MBV9544973.1 heparin lyase I family protein [Chloroflexota bacterium]